MHGGDLIRPKIVIERNIICFRCLATLFRFSHARTRPVHSGHRGLLASRECRAAAICDRARGFPIGRVRTFANVYYFMHMN